MALTNRRQFIQRGAFAAAALCADRIKAIADLWQPSEASEQDLNSLDPAAIQRLGSQISGLIITPESTEYESARMVFNRAFDRRPALIVRCAEASDVARTLDFVQKQNLPLAVRGGGHNRAGFGVCDGGAVIDLSRMNRVDVDPRKGVARAEGGALVRDLDQATQAIRTRHYLGRLSDGWNCGPDSRRRRRVPDVEVRAPHATTWSRRNL